MSRISDECLRWDERYRDTPDFFGSAPSPFLVAAVTSEPRSTRGSALCIGEGEGRDAIFLAQLGYRVAAIDGSKVAVDRIRARAGGMGVDVDAVHLDLEDWKPLVRHYDLIASFYCHLPPDLRTRTHTAAARALRPGGLLLIEGFSVKQLSEAMASGGPRNAALLFTAEQLRADVGSLVEIEELFEGRSDISYGRHTGPAFVTRLRARASRDQR